MKASILIQIDRATQSRMTNTIDGWQSIWFEYILWMGKIYVSNGWRMNNVHVRVYPKWETGKKYPTMSWPNRCIRNDRISVWTIKKTKQMIDVPREYSVFQSHLKGKQTVFGFMCVRNMLRWASKNGLMSQVSLYEEMEHRSILFNPICDYRSSISVTLIRTSCMFALLSLSFRA